MQCNLDLIHCSTTLLETIPRFMSNIHRAHIFSLQTWFLRDRICFFTVLLEYCFPKWINRRSNRTYNYNDEFIRLLFWTISQLCYLQKKKKNCQISEFDKFFLFLITVNPPLFPKLRISWRDPGIFIINFLININSYVWSSFIKYY